MRRLPPRRGRLRGSIVPLRSRATSNSRGLCSGCRVFRLIPFRLIPLLRPSTALLG